MEKDKTTALKKGIAYIGALQNGHGYWEDFAISEVGSSNQWVTGYIGYALLQQNDTSEYLKKAAAWLLASELPGGGWGYNHNTLADADSTANAIRLLANFSEINGNKKRLYRSADFLLSFQDHDTGGFVTYRPDMAQVFARSKWCKPEISVTAMSGLALLGIAGKRYREVLLHIKKFLLKRQLPEGCWDSYWWNGPMYSAGLSVSFLKQTGEDAAVKKGLAWIIGQLDSPLSPFDTALALSALKTAHDRQGGYAEIADTVLIRLLEMQRPDGSWDPDPILKVPDPYENLPPWERIGNIPTRCVEEQHRLFTTATAVGALKNRPIG